MASLLDAHEKTFNSLIGTAKARAGPTHPEPGDAGIDRFGHFAGLTASLHLRSFEELFVSISMRSGRFANCAIGLH